MRAISVLGNAKSNRHRKTHRVEPGGTGRKFMHLTWGGLPREKSAEAVLAKKAVKAAGAKGRRTQEGSQPTDRPEEGEESCETHRERQLRQLPGAAESDRLVDPGRVRIARRQVFSG